jgi:protein CWC15
VEGRGAIAKKGKQRSWQQCWQDDEAELLAELARIKKEREEEARKRAAEEAAAAASNRQAELTRGNPLIASKFDKSADFQVLPG